MTGGVGQLMGVRLTMRAIFAFLIPILATLLYPCSGLPLAPQDAAILSSIRAALDSPSMPPTWSGNINDACGNFHWLTCETQMDGLNHITRFEKTEMEIYYANGVFPCAIFDLPYLRVLTLRDNFLYDSSPSDCPNACVNNTKLTRFDVFKNRFKTSPLPRLEGCLNLTQLAFDVNQFNGTIPSNWGSLQLTSLLLNANNLTGTIPAGVWHMPLVFFAVGGNKLHGTIPADATTRPSYFMDLSSNMFNGPIPNWVFTLQNQFSLQYTDLDCPTMAQMDMLSPQVYARFYGLVNCNLPINRLQHPKVRMLPTRSMNFSHPPVEEAVAFGNEVLHVEHYGRRFYFFAIKPNTGGPYRDRYTMIEFFGVSSLAYDRSILYELELARFTSHAVLAQGRIGVFNATLSNGALVSLEFDCSVSGGSCKFSMLIANFTDVLPTGLLGVNVQWTVKVPQSVNGDDFAMEDTEEGIEEIFSTNIFRNAFQLGGTPEDGLASVIDVISVSDFEGTKFSARFSFNNLYSLDGVPRQTSLDFDGFTYTHPYGPAHATLPAREIHGPGPWIVPIEDQCFIHCLIIMFDSNFTRELLWDPEINLAVLFADPGTPSSPPSSIPTDATAGIVAGVVVGAVVVVAVIMLTALRKKIFPYFGPRSKDKLRMTTEDPSPPASPPASPSASPAKSTEPRPHRQWKPSVSTAEMKNTKL